MSNRRGPKFHIFPWLLLAGLCVGGAELIACRYADPQLFRQLTTPAIQTAQAVGQQVGPLLGKLEGWTASVTGETQPVFAPEEPAPSPFLVRNQRELLTGGMQDVVYYNQTEEPWAEESFGGDSMADYGCGPTTLAMALSTLTGQTLTPTQVAQWASQKGYHAPQQGSYLSIVEGAAAHFGLALEDWPVNDPQDLYLGLVSGRMFIALMGPGDFTQSGHFLLLRGVTQEGEILVADSNSRSNSTRSWAPEVLFSQLSKSQGSGAPLWCLAPAYEGR